MSGQRVTNAELVRRLDAMFERLDAIASGINDMKVTLRLMDSRVTALEEEMERHRKVLFGENGGREKPGVVDDLRDVQRVLNGTRRALWAVALSILSGLGLWFAHTVLGLRW